MNALPKTRHRRSLRLRGYDYSQAGAYFVTVCTQGRQCLFGDVVEGEMQLNDAGRVLCAVWDALPTHYPGVGCDAFVVMPNHVHGIIALSDHPVGAQFIAPPIAKPSPVGTPIAVTMRTQGAMNRARTVGDVVRGFKARVTAGLNSSRPTRGNSVWQRNYYEHIIRDDDELNHLRRYIIDNPRNWGADEENPKRGAVARPP